MKHFLNDMDDELLVKFLLDEVTEDERLQVHRWINETSTNRKYFTDFQTIWQQSRELAKSSEVNEDAAWLRFKQRIAGKGQPAIVVPFKKKYPWLKIAAAFVLFFGVAAILYYVSTRPIEPMQFASAESSSVDTLPDNSVITLNRHSQLTYQEKSGAGSYRKAILKGEGFFRIAPDKTKPFFVEVNDIEVKVVGTAFNIKSLAEATEIIVESGVVNVTKNNKSITLVKGEKIVIPRNGSIPLKQKNDDQLYNYYSSRQFVCDQTPLWRLIEVLNEAYDTNIILENQAASKLRLTTTFNNEPIDNILAIIAETFELSVEKKKGRIILK